MLLASPNKQRGFRSSWTKFTVRLTPLLQSWSSNTAYRITCCFCLLVHYLGWKSVRVIELRKCAYAYANRCWMNIWSCCINQTFRPGSLSGVTGKGVFWYQLPGGKKKNFSGDASVWICLQSNVLHCSERWQFFKSNSMKIWAYLVIWLSRSKQQQKYSPATSWHAKSFKLPEKFN